MAISECEMISVVFSTTFGWAGVAATASGLCRVVLPKKDRRSVERELKSSELKVRSTTISNPSALQVLTRTAKLIQSYFLGQRVAFDVAPDLRACTPFQRMVWKATASIPYGETRSYGWIARKIRKPLAARAVGRAMGANPVPLLIP